MFTFQINERISFAQVIDNKTQELGTKPFVLKSFMDAKREYEIGVYTSETNKLLALIKKIIPKEILAIEKYFVA